MYKVPAYSVAVITRYGEVQKTVDAGLNFKMPFIDRATIIPVRGPFEWQSAPLEFVTADGQRVTLRAKMRYRISDPARYYLSILSQPEKEVANRLGDIFYAIIMAEANKHPLNEFVLSVRNLSLQKVIHDKLNTKLKQNGMWMHEVDEPYEVLETSLK